MASHPVNRRVSRRMIAASLALILLVLGGVTYWVVSTTAKPGTGVLSVWEENCSIVYFSPSMPNAGSVCVVPINPVSMPASFNLSSIGARGATLHDIYLGVVLGAGESVKVSMNASSPANFHVYFDNRTGYDVGALGNEALNYGRLIVNSTGIVSYDQSLRSEKGGLYIFELFVDQPSPIATASFDVQRLTN